MTGKAVSHRKTHDIISEIGCLFIPCVEFSYMALLLLTCRRPLEGPGMLCLDQCDHSRTLTRNFIPPKGPLITTVSL